MPSSNCICSYQGKKHKTQRHILEIHSLKQHYKRLGKKAETNDGRKPMKSYTDNTPAI